VTTYPRKKIISPRKGTKIAGFAVCKAPKKFKPIAFGALPLKNRHKKTRTYSDKNTYLRAERHLLGGGFIPALEPLP